MNDELLIKSNYFNFKINTHLNQKKQDLIGKIKNGGLSKQFFKRQQFLLQKSVDGTITAKEQEEALQMIPISSNWDLTRIKWILQLADLRKTTLEAVRISLSIAPSENVYP